VTLSALKVDGADPGSDYGLVSVVVPSYNHAHFLGEAIESVLAQDYPAFEIIVVNDGSTDGTADVVARYSAVRYVASENQGLAAARNLGLTQCRGEFVVFLDADDRLIPGALATGARLLRENPSVGFAAGYSRFISRDGVPQPTTQPLRADEDAYVALLRRNSIRNPAMVMFRRHIVEAAGGFALGVDACADYDMYLRISRDYPVAFHDAVVADYRKHDENMSSDSARMLRELLHTMRRQRPHLTTRIRRQAWREGVRHVRDYYGDALAWRIRRRIRKRSEWRRVLRDVVTLMRCHPRGGLVHAQRRMATWWRGRRPAGEPAGRTPPAYSPRADPGDGRRL
jgi:glycosyltransferase involved in cell wall biosynthesis